MSITIRNRFRTKLLKILSWFITNVAYLKVIQLKEKNNLKLGSGEHI